MREKVNMNHKVKKSDGSDIQELRKKKEHKKPKKEFLPNEGEDLKEFLINLMSCGAHFGHPSTHPTSATLAIGKTNGCNIINLQYTKQALGEVLNKIYNIISDGGKILFVNTANGAELFEKIALETGQPFIAGTRYRPGFITNLEQILKQMTSFEKAVAKLDSDSLTKKEKKVIKTAIEKDVIYFRGLRSVEELPKAIITTGNAHEYSVLRQEAQKKNIFFFCLSDLNSENLNKGQEISIPCNVQSKETIEFIGRYISQAILEGYESYIQTHGKDENIRDEQQQLSATRKKTQEEIEKSMLENIMTSASAPQMV